MIINFYWLSGRVKNQLGSFDWSPVCHKENISVGSLFDCGKKNSFPKQQE